VHSLHQKELLLLGDGHQLVELLKVERERLLAQDMLPSEQCALGVGVVEGMRRADVDDIDVLHLSSTATHGTYRIIEHLVVRPVRLAIVQQAVPNAPSEWLPFGFELVDEHLRGRDGAGPDSGDLVGDVRDRAGGRVDEEVLR
jgi:hypothetical protein